MTPPEVPRICPAGDAGVVVELGDAISPETRQLVRSWVGALRSSGLPGLVDVVPSYRSVLIVLDPLVTDGPALVKDLGALVVPAGEASPGPMVEIPVCYGADLGPDLEFVAAHNGLTTDEVICIHSSTDYPIYMFGFMPGFAYLGGLPGRIRAPRLPTPRRMVPEGSVGIAGDQTGVYPLASPGGWRLIGRTPLRLFDPGARQPFALGQAGVVRFRPIDRRTYDELQRAPTGRSGDPSWLANTGGEAHPEASIECVEPGLFTTVQDQGRPGHAALGLTASGAADRFAHDVANLIVGNPAGEATLEITATGPRLRFVRAAAFTVTGAEFDLYLARKRIPVRTLVEASPGQELSFGRRRRGLRAYLAFAGGIDVAPVLGSRSTFTRAGLGGYGGRALRAGDSLRLGSTPGTPPARPLGTAPAEWFDYLDEQVARVVAGPQDHLFESLSPLFSGSYAVRNEADRMGIRLAGAKLAAPTGHDVISDGIVAGAMQIPADGEPIVMLSDHHTTGGYPKPATVITADLRILAQKAPGDLVGFVEVSSGKGALAARTQRDLLGGTWGGRVLRLILRDRTVMALVMEKTYP